MNGQVQSCPYRAKGNRITGLGAPVDDTDAVRKGEVVNLVKPYDDSARAAAEAAEAWASDAAQSAVNATFNAERSETSAAAALLDALRAEAAADSIDPALIEQSINALAEWLASHHLDEHPHPHYHPSWLDISNLPNFFPAKWGAPDNTVTGFDPKDFGYVKVWENLSSTLTAMDCRTNFGDGLFYINCAQNNYSLQTTGSVNLVMAGGGIFYLGNTLTTSSPNYIQRIWKLVKN